MNYQDYLAEAKGQWYAIGAAIVVIQTVLIATVPRRWLVRTILIWLFIPQICLIAAMAYETATREPTPNPFSNFMFGFGLVTIITIIPWAIVSALGFALGFILRRILRPKALPA